MSDYDGILQEDMNHKLDILLEGMEPLKTIQVDVATLKNDMVEVKLDIKVIKAVVTEHSSILKNHDQRLTKIEKVIP